MNEILRRDLTDTARKVAKSGIEPLDPKIYNYKMSEGVYFLRDGTVAKYFEDNRSEVIGRNQKRLKKAGIVHPETKHGPIPAEDVDWTYSALQPRENRDWFEEIKSNPREFVRSLKEDVIDPAAEHGYTLDTKPHNLYKDEETGRIGILDIQDGVTVKTGKKNPSNWMWFNFQLELNEEVKKLEGVKTALNEVPD